MNAYVASAPVQVWDLIRATFHIQDKGKIYEYDAAVKHKDKSNLYISRLTPRLSQSYFSFLWELEGIITLKNLTEMAVTTYKIGGGHLGFYLYKDQVGDLTLPDNIISVKVRFEDGSEITVVGKITKKIKIGTKLYCEYKYLNIPESTRDKIFGQIFKKQTQMRQGPFGLRI
jgi:hypothetical protein